MTVSPLGPRPPPMRLAEFVGALSLATDLGTGQPMEHALRTCLLSLELARRSGVASGELREVYYLALLRFVGCTADASETAAAVGGDDIGFFGAMGAVTMGSEREQFAALSKAVGVGLPAPRRLGRVAATIARGAKSSLTEHCDAARRLAARLDVGAGVVDGLASAYERWDGSGVPGERSGEGVPAAVRVVIVARDVDLWTRAAGRETAVEVMAGRSGRAYDPAVAGAFVADPEGVLRACAVPDVWEAMLRAEPGPALRVVGDRLDVVLEAFADFADLKSPWLRGHSRGVAALAADAALVDGADDADVTAVRRAGLVHDIGRVGIASGIWDTPGSLSVDAWERVRLHPYLTERVLNRSPALAGLARLAGCHHERSDGSGYHRGAREAELSLPDRVLAAADAFHAMTEDRPHRPARSPAAAATELRRGARDGLFDPALTEAVVEAAGLTPERRPAARPAGLTEREIEVLRLLARGRSNRQVANALGISAKTVGAHVEHIYAKAGVGTRAGAALFAMEHGLLTSRTGARIAPDGR
jgi:HD-GYP domain-containing protein (c-di-GMP phosphodiesterase class II)